MDDETIQLIKKYNKVQSKYGPIDDRPIIKPETEDSEYNELYARLAGESYKPIDERGDIGDYKYIKDESTDNIAVFNSPKDYHISIKGTSKENILPSTFQDVLVGVGSIGSLIPDNLGLGLIPIKNKIDKLKKQKSVSLSGHSLGGSKASMLGVIDKDLKVYTYNKGDVLPFIGDTLKCAITGCENIKNYRIAGDIVSGFGSIYSTQNIETIAPKQLTPEKETLFSSTENIVPKNIYIPHSIEQFTDRTKLYPKSTFPRKLYSQVGHYAGIGFGIYYGPQILSSITSTTIKPIINTLIEQGDITKNAEKKLNLSLEKIMEDEEFLSKSTIGKSIDRAQKEYIDELKKDKFIYDFIPTTTLKNVKYYSGKLNNIATSGTIGGYVGQNVGGYIYDSLNYYNDDD